MVEREQNVGADILFLWYILVYISPSHHLSPQNFASSMLKWDNSNPFSIKMMYLHYRIKAVRVILIFNTLVFPLRNANYVAHCGQGWVGGGPRQRYYCAFIGERGLGQYYVTVNSKSHPDPFSLYKKILNLYWKKTYFDKSYKLPFYIVTVTYSFEIDYRAF